MWKIRIDKHSERPENKFQYWRVVKQPIRVFLILISEIIENTGIK